MAAINWDQWVNQPGMPPQTFDFTTASMNKSIVLADQYIQLLGKKTPSKAFSYLSFPSNVRVVFVERLYEQRSRLSKNIIKRIDDDLNITNSSNPEVCSRWFKLGIRLSYRPAMKKAQQFVSSQGRLKYIIPIYQTLLDNKQRSVAINWFESNKKFYHPIAISKLESMLKLRDWEVNKDMFFYYRAAYHDFKEWYNDFSTAFGKYWRKKGYPTPFGIGAGPQKSDVSEDK